MMRAGAFRILDIVRPLGYYMANSILDEVTKALDDALCPECGEFRPYDDRVRAQMKCGPCAYGAAS